jgi:hypothetical protein
MEATKDTIGPLVQDPPISRVNNQFELTSLNTEIPNNKSSQFRGCRRTVHLWVGLTGPNELPALDNQETGKRVPPP